MDINTDWVEYNCISLNKNVNKFVAKLFINREYSLIKDILKRLKSTCFKWTLNGHFNMPKLKIRAFRWGSKDGWSLIIEKLRFNKKKCDNFMKYSFSELSNWNDNEKQIYLYL